MATSQNFLKQEAAAVAVAVAVDESNNHHNLHNEFQQKQNNHSYCNRIGIVVGEQKKRQRYLMKQLLGIDNSFDNKIDQHLLVEDIDNMNNLNLHAVVALEILVVVGVAMDQSYI